MKHVGPLLFILLYAVNVGCDRRHQAGDVDHHAVRFLAVGDSYTSGESVSPAERWPVQLAARMRARGVDVGEPTVIAQTGWTVGDLSDAIDEADPRGPYGVVGLLIGVNDQFRGVPADAYRGRFVAMLKRAIAFAGGNARHVVVLSIPDWGVMPFAAGQDRAEIGRQIDAFNAVDREACARAGAAFVDVTPVSREATTQPALGAPDGLHPSGAQYARWATLADTTLRASGQ